MDHERLNQRTGDFLKGVHQLERAVAQPFDEFTRDATIQRFELCYELARKMRKLKLEQEGSSARTPRQALQECLAGGADRQRQRLERDPALPQSHELYLKRAVGR